MKRQRVIAISIGALKLLKAPLWYRLRLSHLSSTHPIDHQKLAFLRLLFPLFFLTGCTIQYPIWLGHDDIGQMCERPGLYAFTHDGDTKEFSIHLVDHLDIPKICGVAHDGNIAQACIINNFDIYVAPGKSCPDSMAHELSHGFGLHFVDRPIVSRGINHG